MEKKPYDDLFQKSKTIVQQEILGSILFTDNSPEGYFSKAELVEFMHSNQGWPNTHLQLAFEHMYKNGNLLKEPEHVIEDAKGITWFKFKQGRVPKVCRILHFGNIKQLLDDYATDKIKVTQTLEQLYQEAIAE
ncbi:hypothetical protein [Pedobacter helvus]|uniref:Uncharacterized protein n=1 Tax=Pedobacter helvus TaxID=2563444 RepID=A0ABW9JDM6_9SPHI|nr:hypothetical protein [Pedobacter ureilyticus]